MLLMVLGKNSQPRQIEKTVSVMLTNWWVVKVKKREWVKGIFRRATKDKILSRPLRQRFKFRVEVKEKRLHLLDPNDPVLKGFFFFLLANHKF